MKNKLLLDIHTHTIASGHAYGTVRENALAAKETGLAGLGLSEHAPGTPGTCHPIYFTNLRAIPRELCGVHIYYGVENNMLSDGTMALPDNILGLLDYSIVGIYGTCYTDQGIEKNTDHLIRCMSHPKTFFVSHPDDGTWPLDYERLVPAAKEYGVALEVNNATVKGGWKKCMENIRTYLVRSKYSKRPDLPRQNSRRSETPPARATGIIPYSNPRRRSPPGRVLAPSAWTRPPGPPPDP